MARLARGLAGLAGLLVLWELCCAIGVLDARFIPPPSTVGPRIAELLGTDAEFALDTIATILTFLIALGLAALIAIPLGLLLGSVRPARIAGLTVVEFLRPLPAVALLPLLMLLLGSGPETKIALATYAALWPILFNTMYALDEMDPLYTDIARSFGFGRVRTMFTVALPHAAPFIATGIRISASIALVVVVVVELIAGGARGVGTFILEASSGGGRMDLVLAGTVIVGAIGYLINSGLQQAQRRLFGWTASREEL